MAWWVLAALVWAMPAFASLAAGSPGVVSLPTGGTGPTELAHSQALVRRDALSIEQVAAGGLDSKFEPASQAEPVAFTTGNELWIPLRLRNAQPQAGAWALIARQTSLDQIVLFEQRDGKWQSRIAGDRVPQAQWARPGRFARFDFRLEPGEIRIAYLRVRNSVPSGVPLQLASEASANSWAARADFGLAFALGALALLVLASLIQATIYSDRTYFIFGAYALLLGFALASISGVADELLWIDAPGWADTAKSAFPLAAAGASIWLVQALCRVRTRSAGLARASTVLGGLVVLLALVSAMLQVTWVPAVAAGMATSAATVAAVSAWTWRRGDRMGLWVLAAHVPLMASTALIVLRMSGVATVAFRPNFLVAISMGFILVLLLVALIRRSRELLAVQVRDRSLDWVDPLTGLPTDQVFRDRVRAAIHRYKRSRHDAVVMYVRLANYVHVRQAHGTAVAEQSMIRTAMKLQHVMREADCFGRVGEATLGLILETVTRREAVLERASRLVAHGLMPLPGLKPEVTLVLHIAAGSLAENPEDAEQLRDALEAELGSMAGRTRRPIRFIRQGAPDAQSQADPDSVAA